MFLSITLATWAGLGLLAGKPRTAQDRLEAPASTRTAAGAASRNPVQANRQLLVPGQGDGGRQLKLGQSLRPSDEQELGKIRVRLLNAGFRHEQAVAVYYGVKAVSYALDRALRGISGLCIA